MYSLHNYINKLFALILQHFIQMPNDSSVHSECFILWQIMDLCPFRLVVGKFLDMHM